jgi:hypothetical protein
MDGGRSDSLTLNEAAAILGISVNAVRQRIKRSTLKGTKSSDGWLVDLTTPTPVLAAPVSEQLGWVLDVLNEGAQALTAADVTARFAPAFLGALPAEEVMARLHVAAGFGPFTLDGFTRLPTETQVNALLTGRGGTPLVVALVVEAPPPTGSPASAVSASQGCRLRMGCGSLRPSPRAEPRSPARNATTASATSAAAVGSISPASAAAARPSCWSRAWATQQPPGSPSSARSPG